ncbi:MAG TPA: DoxX family protein [Jatrophihabitantaceae bacterium]|jgi:hypothetical protein
MFVAYLVVTLATVAANAGMAAADLARAKFVRANAAEVGVPESWVPGLAALKAAGAAGLLLGLAGVRPLGIAAAVGLVLFFAVALTFHVRARVFYNIAFPGAFWALAIGSLALSVAA